MQETYEYDLSNILVRFSDAIDMVNEKLAKHQNRTAYIAFHIACELKLSQEEIESVFIAALFHDVGALTPDEKVELHEFEELDPLPHCLRGQTLFDSCEFLKPISSVVRYHHTNFVDLPGSMALSNNMLAQIIHLSDYIERHIRRDEYILFQSNRLRHQTVLKASKEIHPIIVEAFLKVSHSESFWLDVVSPYLSAQLEREGPLTERLINLDELVELTGFFRMLIDFRSSFTASHSTGVVKCTELLCEYLDFDKVTRQKMMVASYLHDVGKIGITNDLIEKPEALSEEEYELMKQHVYNTHAILSGIKGFQDIEKWASKHHERLDGTGYPFKNNFDDLELCSRVLAVGDIFTALIEDRPYRQGMEIHAAREIMIDFARRGKLDEEVIQVLVAHIENIYHQVRDSQEKATCYYQEQLLFVNI
jgi:HD-GYP domain-containing protein (c-di-GMP phosphodiesterase class II)